MNPMISGIAFFHWAFWKRKKDFNVTSDTLLACVTFPLMQDRHVLESGTLLRIRWKYENLS